MEPVTHILTGACLARSGLNRKAAYVTAVMAVAAEFPDIDTLWSLRGPISGFAHHRGITHTLLGIPFEAAFLVGLACCFHYLRKKSAPPRSPAHVQNRAPVRWAVLYACAVLALLSHILLDCTNNYGVRPFYPFSPRWYAGSFVFILDPLILLFLIAGLVLPHLFGLVNREVGAQRERYPGALWARVALCAMVGLWCLRIYAHGEANMLAASQTMRAPAVVSEAEPASPSDTTGAALPSEAPLLRLVRSWSSPDPFSPFRWYVASDFGPAYQLATVDLLHGTYVPYRSLNKEQQGPCLRAARVSELGKVYLDWSPMPWLRESRDVPPDAPSGVACIVYFEDPRFMSSSALLSRGKLPPLTGTVLMNEHGIVTAEGIDQRFGK